MTAPGTPVSSRQQRGARGEAWLRRTGGVAVTFALIVLGLGAGLYLGSPASAAPGSIQVDMGDGHFVSSTPTKLLDIAALAPGGSVTGTMKVRDTSGADESHGGDAITLRSLHVRYGESCPLLRAECRAASRALGEQISFTISATGPGGTGISTSSLKTLGSRGVVIGTGMADGDTLSVTVTAALDFDAVGDDVQYGSVTFDLALELRGSDDAADVGAGTSDDEGLAGNGSGGAADPSGIPQVAGVDHELPSGTAGNPVVITDGDDILVLGESASTLPDTGVPVGLLLTVGGAVLAAGLVLLWAARRRSA